MGLQHSSFFSGEDDVLEFLQAYMDLRIFKVFKFDLNNLFAACSFSVLPVMNL